MLCTSCTYKNKHVLHSLISCDTFKCHVLDIRASFKRNNTFCNFSQGDFLLIDTSHCQGGSWDAVRGELYHWAAIQILITMPGPYFMVKVYSECIPARLFTSTSSTPLSLQAKPVERLSGCSRCGLLVCSLSSPLPHSVPSHPFSQHNSPERICILAADWPGAVTLPRASSTNGDSVAWLIGRGLVASLHFSFFCFKQ